jgi:NitT/TauT family transport system permease protein
MSRRDSARTRTIALWSVLLWLVIWEIASLVIGHAIILVSPVQVLFRLGELLASLAFWQTILSSFSRIIAGFFLALFVGIVLAIASARFKLIAQLVAPPLLFIKATPVASFIILILLWISPLQLSLAVSFLIVLPIVFSNVLEGINTTSTPLLEMAQVFKMPPLRVARYIHLPHVIPFFSAACSVSLGLCWKAGIAAEIIAIPKGSIGEQLYMAKLYLATTDVFAWTVVIIIISFLFERAFLKALSMLVWHVEHTEPKPCRPRKSLRTGKQPDAAIGSDVNKDIVISGLVKSFGEEQVFSGLDCHIKHGTLTCFVAPSGFGKTTLLNILLGLETYEQGAVCGLEGKRISVVFQEDRLCLALDALANCLITAAHDVQAGDAIETLQALGLEEHIHKPVGELSGGMSRRVALARALLAPRDLLILDEPFKGLDDELKQTVLAYVQKVTQGTTVVLVTHDHHEAQVLGARIVKLD